MTPRVQGDRAACAHCTVSGARFDEVRNTARPKSQNRHGPVSHASRFPSYAQTGGSGPKAPGGTKRNGSPGAAGEPAGRGPGSGGELLSRGSAEEVDLRRPGGDLFRGDRAREVEPLRGVAVQRRRGSALTCSLATPSATTSRPRLCARSIVERTIAALSSSAIIVITNDLSILSTSSGSRFR